MISQGEEDLKDAIEISAGTELELATVNITVESSEELYSISDDLDIDSESKYLKCVLKVKNTTDDLFCFTPFNISKPIESIINLKRNEDNMDSRREKSRIEWIDIAKGIAMLSIIAGHMGNPEISKVVFPFHVPLFLLVSGYFISFQTDFVTFAKKKMKALLIPYALVSAMLVLAKIPVDLYYGKKENILLDMKMTFLYALYGSGSGQNKTLWNMKMIGAIWFLLALLWASLLVKWLIEKKFGFLAIAVIAVISYISSKYVWLPWSLQAGGTSAIFVYLGAWFKKKGLKLHDHWLVIAGGFVVLILESHYRINLSLARNHFEYSIVSIIGAVIISYAILCLSRKMERIRPIKKFFCFYGSNSIIILSFHLVEASVFQWNALLKMLSFCPVSVQYLCVFIVRILLITCCTWLALQFKGIRNLFGK